MSNKKYLITIVFLIVALIFSVFLTLKTTIFLGRANSTNSNVVVLENSYLFASPIQAKAGGDEKIRVTVFLLDSRGLGVSDREVDLVVEPSLDIKKIQAISDDSGRAVFDISSGMIRSYQVMARLNGRDLPQRIKVAFY